MTLCGHKIAVVTGSTQAEKYLPQISGDCSAQGKPAVEAVVLPNVQAALTQLASKRIEGVFNDTSQLAWAAKQQPQAFELFPQQYKKKVGNSIVALGVAKNSPLAPALHAAMQSLMAGPAYKATLDKWGLGSGAIPTSELLKYAMAAGTTLRQTVPKEEVSRVEATEKPRVHRRGVRGVRRLGVCACWSSSVWPTRWSPTRTTSGGSWRSTSPRPRCSRVSC